MTENKMPNLSDTLFERIRLVRRDFSDLLFHFTRTPETRYVSWGTKGFETTTSSSGLAVLQKILYEGILTGTSKWTYNNNCVCFSESPITEFNSLFSLNQIAASTKDRPRYEPYGIAVNKKWLFSQGGRPVIYDHPSMLNKYPDLLKYRFAPYNPLNGIDYTWEREWRVKTDSLTLDPNNTLVVVPTATEAFNLAYELADMEADVDVGDEGEAYVSGAYHVAKWLTVSLDIFGFSNLK